MNTIYASAIASAHLVPFTATVNPGESAILAPAMVADGPSPQRRVVIRSLFISSELKAAATIVTRRPVAEAIEVAVTHKMHSSPTGGAVLDAALIVSEYGEELRLTVDAGSESSVGITGFYSVID